MSDNEARAMCEDRSGTLWIGTNNGLNRFDRRTGEFLSYRHDSDDPYSLASNRIRALLEDRSGMLWVGTRGGGLHRFDPQTSRFHRYQQRP